MVCRASVSVVGVASAAACIRLPAYFGGYRMGLVAAVPLLVLSQLALAKNEKANLVSYLPRLPATMPNVSGCFGRLVFAVELLFTGIALTRLA